MERDRSLGHRPGPKLPANQGPKVGVGAQAAGAGVRPGFRAPPLHIIPHHEAVQIAPAGEEHPAGRRGSGQPLGKLHGLARLRPARKQKDVDRDSYPPAEQPLAKGGLLGSCGSGGSKAKNNVEPSKWAVGKPSVISTICRLGVSAAASNCRPSCSACWMLVKWGNS